MKIFTRFKGNKVLASAALFALALIAGSAIYPLTALQTTQAPTGYIQGVVRSATGVEAGVWVIAETKDTPTPLIKIVVTDDQGRYMLPELPAANYSVWVRGYGLADSVKVTSRPITSGNTALNLTAVKAKDAVEAAKIYPGSYWMQMLEPPAKTAFPLGGTQASQQNLENWMHTFKSSCNFCHQLGNGITREMKHVFAAKPEFKTSTEAWDYRLQAGIRGTTMSGAANSLNRPFALKMFSDWTDRIAKGETPKVIPPRPTGIERNVVVTLWDWGTDHSFMHDMVATSKYTPTVNAGNRVYAVSAGHGTLVVLDPKTNSTNEIEIPTRDPRASVTSRFPAPNPPSLWWGTERLWANPPYNPADPHNAMLDDTGRVWLTTKIRQQAAAWCRDGALNKSAAWDPLGGGGRQASYYDPKTQKFQLIETCYSTHHLQFDNDANRTVYFNELSGPIFGWIDTKVYDDTLAATKDEAKAEQAAVGWCSQVIDTNGDGKITKPWQNAPNLDALNLLYQTDTAGGGATVAPPAPVAAPVAPAAAPAAPPARGGAAQGAAGAPAGGGRGRGAGAAAAAPFNPALDTRVNYNLYSVIPSPVDDSVWGVSENYPGTLVRLKRGNNAPESCVTQIFRVPSPGDDPRGVDIDGNGVVWTALAASAHLASFDVRKCGDMSKATFTQRLDGSLCKEGWTLHLQPGPNFQGTNIPTDFNYFNWVDQKNILGLGANTPMATGSNSDSILALNPTTRAWTVLRVPYPLGFYSRGMDGRIDDPNAPAGFAGWKNRAIWGNYGTHFVWHIEGGKGTKGKLVKFQIRPTPLDR
jgi:hypothetical protein